MGRRENTRQACLPALSMILSLLCFSHLLLISVSSVEDEVKRSLKSFVCGLSEACDGNDNFPPNLPLNWTDGSDPCSDAWTQVVCNHRGDSVTRLFLNGLNLSGSLNLDPLCKVPSMATSLSMLVLDNNSITGQVSPDISSCSQLTRFQVSGNRLGGDLPDSLSKLSNLKKIDLSFNNFSGSLPKLGKISGLKTFDARNNSFTGKIPKFDFSNLNYFNVSYNNLTGPIPGSVDGRRFDVYNFVGNDLLCGAPLPNSCPKSKNLSAKHALMYSGYAIVGLVLISFVAYKISRQKKEAAEEAGSPKGKAAALEEGGNKQTIPESDETSKMTANSIESGPVSNTLVVLTSPTANGLRFEDLLRAPAELLGRGKHGSLYKVICENGMSFAVKRIKGWPISSEEFKKRMQRIDEVKHPNVLPVVAFYSSKQEKLLVYEYQQSGSLFRLLHGIQLGQTFEWTARLNVASAVSEALATMHGHLRHAKIAHGNLKSSNILFDKNMDPSISEYGLIPSDIDTPPEYNNSSSPASAATFEADVYALGVILLELLTGKLVQNNGFDLAKWVHSVVREEWTAEVFDKSLISEGASEERMVSLLQTAVKCVNLAPASRPSADQVAAMVKSIRDDEDRSLAYEP